MTTVKNTSVLWIVKFDIRAYNMTSVWSSKQMAIDYLKDIIKDFDGALEGIHYGKEEDDDRIVFYYHDFKGNDIYHIVIEPIAYNEEPIYKKF